MAEIRWGKLLQCKREVAQCVYIAFIIWSSNFNITYVWSQLIHRRLTTITSMRPLLPVGSRSHGIAFAFLCLVHNIDASPRVVLRQGQDSRKYSVSSEIFMTRRTNATQGNARIGFCSILAFYRAATCVDATRREALRQYWELGLTRCWIGYGRPWRISLDSPSWICNR